jgi:O-antigen ligase
VNSRALTTSGLGCWRSFRADSNIAFATVICLLALAVAVSTTLNLGMTESWFDDQRIVATAALIACSSIAILSTGMPSVERMAIVALAALVLGLISCLLAERPFAAALEWATFAMVCVTLLHLLPTSKTTIANCAALVGLGIASAYCTGVVSNYVASLTLRFPVSSEIFLVGFANPRFPGQLQALTLPLLFVAYTRCRHFMQTHLVMAIAVLWWTCLIGSGSRTGWIAVAVAGVVVSVLAGRRSARLLKFGVVGAIGGMLCYATFFLLIPEWFALDTALESGRFSDFGSVNSRWILGTLALELAVKSPLLGAGPMHFAYFYNGEGAHPHNLALQLIAEWGFVAAALFAALIAGLGIALARAVRRNGDCDLGMALLAAFTVWLVGVQADGYLVIPSSQLVSALILMLAYAYVRTTDPVPDVRTRSIQLSGQLWRVVGILSISISVGLAVSPFGRPSERERLWRAEHPQSHLWPRFWQQGWIGPDQDHTARRSRNQ